MIRHCALALVLLSALASCTPRNYVTVHRYCDGDFWIREDGVDCLLGDLTIDGRTNIRGEVNGELIGRDSLLKDVFALVEGAIDDVCQDASVTYTHPCGRMTVNLPRASLKATAPENVQTSAGGAFRYTVRVECCPNTGGDQCDVRTSASSSVAFVRVNTPVYTCPGSGLIEVSGVLTDEVHGGWVSVTITGPRGACELTSNVN